jgi:uncharacterized protein YjbI with pentapeptide repeats
MLLGMELLGIPIMAVVALLMIAILLLGYTVFSHVMGFGVTRVEWEDDKGVKYRPPKTFWDWLELSGPWSITVLLALVGTQYSAALQNQAQQAEEERAEATEVQTYIDQMTQHLIENNLRQSKEGSEPRIAARAQTLAVLEELEPDRKTQVLRFLIAAKLVQRIDHKEPVISLSQANLQGVELHEANLQGADLASADLSEAVLIDADLRSAVLSAATLRDANLSTGNDDTTDTNLTNADLKLANLSGTNLRGAEGATNEHLEDQAETLRGATMPNGQKYEDWLKDREGRKEAGENNGPS